MEENSKLRTASKVKERRQPFNQGDGQPKRIPKQAGIRRENLSHLVPPESFASNSPVDKVLNEANKIIKIGMEREFALLEKNTTLQNSNDTIDNLRKNILHIQMEYEKLDQNYQREISYRGEIIKRMDATKDIVESTVQYSNTLAASVKQLEEDKFKIVEFYELIYEGQKEIEGKHAKVEKFLRDQDDLLKAKLEEVKRTQEKTQSQYSEAISDLHKKLAYSNDKLKIITNANEKLKAQHQESQETINNLETSVEQQQKENYQLEDKLTKLKILIKMLKNQKFQYQKLWSNKKKQIQTSRNQAKKLKKKLLEIKQLYNTSSSSKKLLELKNKELEKLMEESEINLHSWTTQKEELLIKLTTAERETKNLEVVNKDLKERVLELMKNEQSKKTESDQLQNDLSKMFNENLQLKEDIIKLREENDGKSKLITDLEVKMNNFDNDLNSEVVHYKNESQKYKRLVKQLETQVTELKDGLSLERTQKEATLAEIDMKMNESTRISKEKIANLEKLVEDKVTYSRDLECQLTTARNQAQSTIELLNRQIREEKIKNEELNDTLKNLMNEQQSTKMNLESTKEQITDYERKLNEEKSSNAKLELSKDEMEKTIVHLRNEMEAGKKSFEALMEKHRETENELTGIREAAEENAGLRTTITDLRKLLGDTEARMEAYKVVVKKLESEKIEAKNKQSDEVLKLKLELSRLEEALKRENDFPRLQTEKDSEPIKGRMIERLTDSSQKTGTKEEEQATEVEKFLQVPSTPQPNTKTILSTPRNSFTSTPKSGFRNLTPIRKKRDPYEFDSDSSAERFDPDKVLKVFNNRQKKDAKKRPKNK